MEKGLNLFANVIDDLASEKVKSEVLAGALDGSIGICLLYSEPGAGSDLASVQTTAVKDGDRWIVNGQKVWTSGAHLAQYGFLIARTDWDQPKHHGLTFFLFPMRQPGVEVRPIRQVTGSADFNEVFITDAVVEDRYRLSEVNRGWAALKLALGYERKTMGTLLTGGALKGMEGVSGIGEDKDDGKNSKGADKGAASSKPAPASPGRAPGLHPEVDLVALAKETGRAGDPLVRQDLARIHTLRQVNKWNLRRAASSGDEINAAVMASLGKLAMSRIEHETGRIEASICGAEAMLAAPASTRGDDAGYALLNAYFTSIGGGTDQIQRNIIGEMILGLPREKAVDLDVPFRDVRRNTTAVSYG